MKRKKYTPTFNRARGLEVANAAYNSVSITSFLDWLENHIETLPEKKTDRRSWYGGFQLFIERMRLYEQNHYLNRSPFAVFKLDGNKKLPFAAFSVLPIVTCPGYGECAKFCYSFTAWRYLEPYARQLQNTLLIKHRKDIIAREFSLLPERVERMRLYVDGDIDTIETLKFWSQQLNTRPNMIVYGYSKSWPIILEYTEKYGPLPGNYVLNLSSGSRYDDDKKIKGKIADLEVSRGEFVAVELLGNYSRKADTKYNDKKYHAEVLQVARAKYPNRKIVSCSGFCGSCGKGSPWCSDKEKLKDVVIAIGVH